MLRLLFILLVCWSSLVTAEPPRRIISLAPHITEIVFKLGAGDRLVGRTEYCLYPAAALKIPSVGAYLNPDYEKIVALNPDIILMLPNNDMQQKFKNLGLKTFAHTDETVEDIITTIDSIGTIVHAGKRTREVIQGIRDTLTLVKNPDMDSLELTALFVVGRDAGSLKGLFAAGDETYLSELWRLCGGSNIFSDIPLRYFSVSKEDLIKRDPGYILEFRVIDPEKAALEIPRLRSDWQELPTLTAVKQHRIVIFPERYFLIPGPRITKIAIAFSAIIAGDEK